MDAAESVEPRTPLTREAMADDGGASNDDEAEEDEDDDEDEDEDGDEDEDEESIAARAARATNRYTRRWLQLPPLLIPPFPPALHAALARPRPALHRVRGMAALRRTYLGKAYQMGGRVSRLGVRVEVPSAAAVVPNAAAVVPSAGAVVSGAAAAHLASTTVAAHGGGAPAAPLRPGAPNLCVSTRTAGEL